MHIDLTDGLRRGLVVAAVAAFISFGVAACNDTTSIDPQRDRIPPTVTLRYRSIYLHRVQFQPGRP